MIESSQGKMLQSRGVIQYIIQCPYHRVIGSREVGSQGTLVWMDCKKVSVLIQ